MSEILAIRGFVWVFKCSFIFNVFTEMCNMHTRE